MTDNDEMRAWARSLFGRAKEGADSPPHDVSTEGNVVPREGNNPVSPDQQSFENFVHRLFWGEPKW